MSWKLIVFMFNNNQWILSLSIKYVTIFQPWNQWEDKSEY